MKKIINFRPLFYCFIALLGSILFAKYIFLSNYLIITIFCVILITTLCSCILQNKIKTFLIIFFFIVLGIGLYTLEMSAFTNTQNVQYDSFVSGRVSENSSRYGTRQYIILENVKINNKSLPYNVYLTLYGSPYLSTGHEIEFKADIYRITALTEDQKIQSTFYKYNCYSAAYKNSDSEITITNFSPNIINKFQMQVKNNLLKNMSEDHAHIAYAMIFGDKSEIDYQTKYDYRTSGISHILAISGLHVGILVSFLTFILKKLKVKNIITLIIISFILLLYCYICSFSPSIVRATIMSICLLLASSFGKRYDSLSSIGLAGLIILLTKPLYAFDVGFQLSFGCVIGIAIFYKDIYNLIRKPIKKIRIPKFLASPLSISISTQLLILPILINTFDGISFLSIFINLLVIPIFTVAFILVFISLPLLFISNFFGNLLWFSGLILEFINICAKFVSSLTWSIIPQFKFAFAVFIVFFCFMFVCSKLFLVKNKSKIIILISLVSVSSLILGLTQIF